MVLYLFLAHLGIGIIFSLLLVSREAGVKFFRFNAGMAAVLIAIALAFHTSASAAAATVDRAALVALWVTEALTVFYWGTIGRAFTRYRGAIVAAASAAGLATLVVQALAVSAAATASAANAELGITGQLAGAEALTVASFVSSAAFLGGACTAMVLGHWYLVLPSMEVSHLQSIVKLHIASMVLRVAIVTATIVFAIAAAWTLTPGGPTFRHYIFSVAGIFFWQRVLFGLAGPAVLSYLTWETAKIRSTQSATGILYVDFFTVVVGEVLAKYLLLATRVPL